MTRHIVCTCLSHETHNNIGIRHGR